MSHRGLLLFLLTTCLPALSVAQEDWTQWRGPRRDGTVAAGTNWPDRLDETHLKPVWRRPLGPGYSGPVVVGDRVFVTETVGKKEEVVSALSRSTGEVLWTTRWPGAMTVPFFAMANGDWIRATPAYESGSLYVAGMKDLLVCLDAETGRERWRMDFMDRFKTPLPAFGFVSSPLVVGDHVYVQAGAAFFKLNKHNGEVVWQSLKDDGGMYGSAFSSPVLTTLKGQRQLVVQTRTRLAGVSDDDGRELWSQEIPAFRGMNILTPTVIDESLFTSAYGGQSRLYSLDGSSSALKEAWKNKTQAYMSSPVVLAGHIYCHLRNQRFACLDAKTGEDRWISQPFGKYWSLVTDGRRILALDERGILLLLRASPEKFELLDERRLTEEPTWGHLAVSGSDLFVRELGGVSAWRWQSPR